MTIITTPTWKMLLYTEYWGKGCNNDRLIEAIEEEYSRQGKE